MEQNKNKNKAFITASLFALIAFLVYIITIWLNF